MVAAAVAERLGLIGEEAGDDDQCVPERLQTGQRGRELEVGADARGQPLS